MNEWEHSGYKLLIDKSITLGPIVLLEITCSAPGDDVYLSFFQAKIKQKLREIEENQKRIEKLEEYITTSKYVALQPFLFQACSCEPCLSL